MAAERAFDPLAHPALSEREIDRLAAVYAPSFEIAIGGDHDRFGRLRWRRAAAGEPPDLDPAQPTVYVRADYARYREHVLLQLAYTIWFAGPYDGVVWRVTLAPDGEPAPDVLETPRVGIAYAGEPWVSVPWRLLVPGSSSLSRPPGRPT